MSTIAHDIITGFGYLLIVYVLVYLLCGGGVTHERND